MKGLFERFIEKVIDNSKIIPKEKPANRRTSRCNNCNTSYIQEISVCKECGSKDIHVYKFDYL